ncbi:transposase InsO family protein [Rhodopseudomonas rhenobacensis]|uniref:Transposase InsO family protein n=1 Tax=Rhodopseudomonas rhenobacensis TaxID=87461 RepID=A0A7W8DYE6_9BRAD|nr:Mu transposase C-terminal domain-containing protein [Rhodopseudomonas rhenobacensis]MBB5046757.1 transposase InsO family protein [Rhodopseudomonas rhenobacensis]
MKEWCTARELADASLASLPDTERGIQLFAQREGWNDSVAYVRRRSGRGGGLEYNVSLLPPSARVEFERRHRVVQAPEPAAVNVAPTLGSGLSDRAARERDARLAVVAAFQAFERGQRLGNASRSKIFVDAYNGGTLIIDAWIRDLIPQLSPRSLARWCAARRAGRADRLAVDRAAARKGKGVLDVACNGRVRAYLLALIAHNPHLSAQHLRTLLRSEFGDQLTLADGQLVEVPPVRTIQHAVAKLKKDEEVALTKLSHPDRYRSTMAPSGVGTYRWVSEPNTLWMIDASPVDALCVDGRHSIYAAIDIATRRQKLYVSRTPRASAVALLIRKAIMAWGAPDKIKTDNGSDFVANDTKRLFAALDIEMELSDAYSPQQKGHVERVIKTFQHDCATLLPGFVGHNVADRKRIEDRKSFAARLGEETAETFGVSLTGAELQAVVDRWVDTVYEQRTHSALGMSPMLAAAGSKRPIRTVDPRALDLLLMPVTGMRTVTKFGIRVDNFHYVINAAFPGDRVMVRQDPIDAGRIIAFDADSGAYVGDGICPELAGVDPAELLRAKREITTEKLAEKTREARKEIKKLTSGRSLIERVLEVAQRDMPNVIALPKREEKHETPAISAALDAMVPREAPQASAEVLAMQAKLIAEETVVPLRTAETPHQLWQRALNVIARMRAGEPVSADEAMWLGGYREGPDFKARALMHGDPIETKNPAASWTDAAGQQSL